MKTSKQRSVAKRVKASAEGSELYEYLKALYLNSNREFGLGEFIERCAEKGAEKQLVIILTLETIASRTRNVVLGSKGLDILRSQIERVYDYGEKAYLLKGKRAHLLGDALDIVKNPTGFKTTEVCQRMFF